MSQSKYLVPMLATLALATASSLACAQSEDPQSAPADAAPSAPARFQAQPDGSVRDQETGLIWAGKDNGGDVDWNGAQSYCQSLGAGWVLPTVDELLKIYMADAQEGQQCIGLLTCKVSPLIQVSGLTPWSAQPDGPTDAWYVYLQDGKAYSYTATSTQGKRALCVRHS